MYIVDACMHACTCMHASLVVEHIHIPSKQTFRPHPFSTNTVESKQRTQRLQSVVACNLEGDLHSYWILRGVLDLLKKVRLNGPGGYCCLHFLTNSRWNLCVHLFVCWNNHPCLCAWVWRDIRNYPLGRRISGYICSTGSSFCSPSPNSHLKFSSVRELPKSLQTLWEWQSWPCSYSHPAIWERDG